MSWFTGFFRREPSPPPEPKKYEVGKLHVIVTDVNGATYELTYNGHVWGSCEWVFTKDSSDLERSYMERCGKNSAAYIGHDTYLPMCRVRDIRFEHLPLAVELIEGEQ